MIVPLTKDTPESLEQLGGKGCGLVRLLRAGVNVPPAWCVAEAAGDRELEAWWANHGDSEVAVRSSATAEDLEGASFAGVYETYLGVGDAAALCRAVRDCRAALHSQRARAYRRQRGLGDDAAMPVIVQRMVRADVAGVMLTANPRRPFANEIVIDAAPGLGEAVVSGTIEPDHVVLDRNTGAVRETRTAGDAPCLSAEQLAQLYDLARAVDRAIGPRQDLEWAFEDGTLYALQQRPITGLPPAEPSNVWTRKFGDEYLADYTMPLANSLLTEWIRGNVMQEMAELMGRHDLAALEPLRRYGGYVYLSGEYVARASSVVPRSLRAGTSWFTPLWLRRLDAVPFEPRRALGVLAAPFRDPRGTLRANLRALARHQRTIERTVVPKLRQNYAALSREAWRAQFDEVYDLGREHFRIIRWGMAFHNPMLHGATRLLLARWAGDEAGELYQAIVSGLPGTYTAAINRSIWRLGGIARADPRLADRIRAADGLSQLRADTANSPFWTAFDAFMLQHGHRAATREISQPRWAETPAVVLGLVRAQLAASSAPPDPALSEAAAVARRRDAERRALEHVGPLRRGVLRRLFQLTQQFTRYRENQRYHLDYLLFHIRRLLLEQARQLCEAGVLLEPFEVFFLEADELEQLARAPVATDALRTRIDERRDHYERWHNRLPATFLFDDVETEGEIVEGDRPPGEPRGDFAGVGASRGRARGPVRITRSLEELAAVQPGEILVANNIDPGWTSVFPLLAGLVTETGGMLSHGALLAREYGIPAVMGVPGATRKFRTGAVIDIDGGSGVISQPPRDS